MLSKQFKHTTQNAKLSIITATQAKIYWMVYQFSDMLLMRNVNEIRKVNHT